MQSAFLRIFLLLAALSSVLVAQSDGKPAAQNNGGDFSTNLHPTEKQKVPEGVIIVKGAWSSASDSVTPVPEGGNVTANVYTSEYFGLTYPLSRDWIEKHKGPPPSESGSYVLAFLTPAATFKGPTRGTMMITAQDMFFTPIPAANALELVNFKKDHLQSDFKMELQPTQTQIAGRPFTFYAYLAPTAELHWYVLDTEIRCHTIEFVMVSRDTKLLESLVLDLNKMKLP